MTKRYRVIPLHGLAGSPEIAAMSVDKRAHGVQAGGCGGRVIGTDWRLDRRQAEKVAAELEIAFEAGRAGTDPR